MRRCTKSILRTDFSLCNLCVLRISVVTLLGIINHKKHRAHRDCTEKKDLIYFCAKLYDAYDVREEGAGQEAVR